MFGGNKVIKRKRADDNVISCKFNDKFEMIYEIEIKIEIHDTTD